MTSSSLRVPLLFLALGALSACSWFRENPSDYKNAHETAPLEVPPGLDVPPRTSQMTVPEAAPAGAAGAAPHAEPAMTTGTSTAGTTKPAYIGTETSLMLQDDVPSAFRRVGIALERAGTVNVISRDEQNGSITVTRNVVTEEGGWFRRVIGKDTSKSTTVTRVVRVSADGEGARVHIEDEAGREMTDETARQIVAALKERLG
jgi:uncharacterized lipoprotein